MGDLCVVSLIFPFTIFNLLPLLPFGHPPPLGEGTVSLPRRVGIEAGGSVYSSLPSPSGGGCRRSGRRGRIPDHRQRKISMPRQTAQLLTHNS